jgi:cell division protein FtsB
MNRHQELLDLVESFRADFEKFYEKGNKTAGTRLRKQMQELKNKAQAIREEVQTLKEHEDVPAEKP